MDNETKEFLTKLFDTLDRRITKLPTRDDLSALESRMAELVAEAKTELLNSMNQWKRARDARILAVEFRVAEIEKRLDQIQPAT